MKAIELEKKLGKKKHKTTSDLKQVLATRADQNPNFCLFLGAGSSRSSGIKTAGEMVKDWRQIVYTALSNSVNETPPLEMQKWLTENESEWYEAEREYSCLIEHIYPLKTNRRKFIETEVADKIPSIGYAYLVRLAEAGLLRTIFTTNFDDLLNEAFYQFSSERALVCAHDSSVQTISITSRRTKIIKLHGDYLYDDLKNTHTETHKLEENMREKFSEFLKEYGLVIAGYSGSDKSVTRILDDMSDKPIYLQNGLFWCFREQDEVNTEVFEILKKPNCFYILSPGFDELMAELYSLLNTEATPFNAKLASDRASSVIDTYLRNPGLASSASKTIKRHLQILEEDKSASLLSDMMRDLNSERIASAGLTDENLLVYLEIERALKDRNPEAALVRLGEELAKTADKRFKEILLHRRFVCSLRLNRLHEAKEAARNMLSLDPGNFYVALSECGLLDDRKSQILYLEQLALAHPFSATVLNRYAEELLEALDRKDKIPDGKKLDDVVSLLQRSLKVDPSLDNDAWGELFSYYSRQGGSTKNEALLVDIVDKHLAQDAYSVNTTAILVRYCRKLKTVDYKGKPLFDYLNEAYTRHFPRNYPAHLAIFVDACIEFEGHRYLRPLLEEARLNEDVADEALFITTMMDVYYDVFRDLPGAIAQGREFLKKHKKTTVEQRLVRLHIENGSYEKARELHANLKGAIDIVQWLQLEAEIMEFEGRFQDAIDVIESIPDRRNFQERYTSTLSFLDLKLGAPARAFKRCKDFLQERSFAIHFEPEIINYEYAKKMDGRNIDKARISAIAENSDRQMVRGVCFSLLDRDEDALKIFRAEAEKRFSRIHDCLRWPAISRHQKDFRAIRDELLRAKRSLNDLPAA